MSSVEPPGAPTATHHYLSQPKEDIILLFLNVSLVTGNTIAVKKKTFNLKVDSQRKVNHRKGKCISVKDTSGFSLLIK